MRSKVLILIISMFYCGYLITIFIASCHSSPSLNPLNSEYYFKMGNYTEAIEKEPLKALYHLYHGLELLKELPRDDLSARIQLCLAKHEFLRAANLAPYSEIYKKASARYTDWIDSQF